MQLYITRSPLRPPSGVAGSPPPAAPTVLIADHHRGRRLRLAAELRAAGYETTAVSSPDELLERLWTWPRSRPFDLVLSCSPLGWVAITRLIAALRFGEATRPRPWTLVVALAGQAAADLARRHTGITSLQRTLTASGLAALIRTLLPLPCLVEEDVVGVRLVRK